MAKLQITNTTVATNNVQLLDDEPTGQAPTIKLSMDQYGIDNNAYVNDVLIAELNGGSGSKKIGHNSASITADNVGDALEENRLRTEQLLPFPDGSITNSKLSADVKVGSLSSLDTFEKSSMTAAFNEIYNKLVYSEQNRPLRVVAGAARNTSGSWFVLSDAIHEDVSILSLTELSDRIRLNYDFSAYKVVALVGVVDETLSAYGVKSGSSVGVDYVDVKMYMPLSAFITGTNTISQSPTFLSSDLSILPLGDGSGFVLTHPLDIDNSKPVVSVLSETSQASGLEARLNWTSTDVTVKSYDDFGGYIYYDGANWQVTTKNINKPTFSFSSGALTVTHEPLNNQNGMGLTGRGVNLPSLGVLSQTQFIIEFYDYTGSKITTPNTDMKVFYHAGQKVVSEYPSDMRVSIRRGDVILTPSNVITASGNIWILGNLEVQPTDIKNI